MIPCRKRGDQENNLPKKSLSPAVIEVFRVKSLNKSLRVRRARLTALGRQRTAPGGGRRSPPNRAGKRPPDDPRRARAPRTPFAPPSLRPPSRPLRALALHAPAYCRALARPDSALGSIRSPHSHLHATSKRETPPMSCDDLVQKRANKGNPPRQRNDRDGCGRTRGAKCMPSPRKRSTARSEGARMFEQRAVACQLLCHAAIEDRASARASSQLHAPSANIPQIPHRAPPRRSFACARMIARARPRARVALRAPITPAVASSRGGGAIVRGRWRSCWGFRTCPPGIREGPAPSSARTHSAQGSPPSCETAGWQG